MKVTLEFDSNEDRAEIECVWRAIDLALTLWDMDQYLRSRLKYGEPASGEEELEAARDKLFELIEGRGIDLDRLIE